MKAPSPPPPPDPYKTANAQQMANIQVAIANTVLQNADEDRPDGTVRFVENGTYTTYTYQYDSSGNLKSTTPNEVPRWKKITALATKGATQFDQQQDISIAFNDAALGLADQLGLALQDPINSAGLIARLGTPTVATIDKTQPVPGALTATIGQSDLVAHIQSVRDAIDDRLQYQYEIDRVSLADKLADQGIFDGSEPFSRAMLALDRKSNDARIQSYLASTQEQTRMVTTEAMVGDFANKVQNQVFTQAIMAIDVLNRRRIMDVEQHINIANFVNAQRAAEFQERVALRVQSVQEVSSLMHGGQVNIPQFQPYQASKISDTPVGEYVYRTSAIEQQQWQAKVQSQQSMMGGIMGLAGNLFGAVMMSDERVKHDFGPASRFIDRVNEMDIQTWRYSPASGLDEAMHVGPTAQEFRRVFGTRRYVQGGIEHISTVDAVGVLFMCIKELTEANDKLRHRLDVLEGKVIDG